MTYGKGSLDGPPLPFHLHLTVSIYKNKRTPEYPPPTRELAPWHLFISACMLLSLHPENGKSSLVQKPHSMFFSCLIISGGVVRIFPKALEHAHGRAPGGAIPRADKSAPQTVSSSGPAAVPAGPQESHVHSRLGWCGPLTFMTFFLSGDQHRLPLASSTRG